jgi:hypothetical protein
VSDKVRGVCCLRVATRSEPVLSRAAARAGAARAWPENRARAALGSRCPEREPDSSLGALLDLWR